MKPFRRVGPELGSDRAPSVRRIGIVVLSIASAAAATLASVGYGAVPIPPGRVAAILWATLMGSHDLSAASDTLILTAIRLPRTVLGLLVGAALGISGTLLQGLFRNPLADPGLVGVSAGAALATAATIVLGDRWLGTLSGAATLAALPVAAFLGGLITTLLLYAIATRQGRTSVATMLLAGIALAALAESATGLLVYLSNDRQLRDLTFWSLGSLGGATWAKVVIAAVFILPVATVVPSLSRSLNALALGEAEAFHTGVAVERTKRSLIVLVALAVGAAVAMTGPIGFIGLVVPHLIRLLAGSDHHVVLPACGILGAAVLVAADTMARTIAAPADVPIGILTAALGAPVLLWLLLSRIGGTDR